MRASTRGPAFQRALDHATPGSSASCLDDAIERHVRSRRGSDLIVHAGDVGSADIIEQLNAIAPTHAVRGNIDTQSWARALPDTRVVEAAKRRFYLLHLRAELALDPVSAGYAAVIFGHSHQPSIEIRNGVLWLNPGSAGPRRFRLPVTIARVRVTAQKLDPEIVALEVR